MDILSAYPWGIVEKIDCHGKEQDLIMRAWRSIGILFDNLRLDILRYVRKQHFYGVDWN